MKTARTLKMTQPINDLNRRVTVVEVQMEERWKEAILRIKRIEFIMITGAGSVIVLLAGIAWKI